MVTVLCYNSMFSSNLFETAIAYVMTSLRFTASLPGMLAAQWRINGDVQVTKMLAFPTKFGYHLSGTTSLVSTEAVKYRIVLLERLAHLFQKIWCKIIFYENFKGTSLNA